MSTQGEEPVDGGNEEFRDSGLDQEHVADAFEQMEAAPDGGALLEGESAERGRDNAEGTEGPDGGADVASGGGEGRREPTSGAVGEDDDEDDGAADR